MSVARAVRSALSLGSTRNALVLIFTMIPSVLVPRAVGGALVDTTSLWVSVGRLPTQGRGVAREVVSRSRYLGDHGCWPSSSWSQGEVACCSRVRTESNALGGAAGPTPGNALPHRTEKDHRGRRSRQGRVRGQHPEGDGDGVWQSVPVTRVPRPMGRSCLLYT